METLEKQQRQTSFVTQQLSVNRNKYIPPGCTTSALTPDWLRVLFSVQTKTFSRRWLKGFSQSQQHQREADNQRAPAQPGKQMRAGQRSFSEVGCSSRAIMRPVLICWQVQVSAPMQVNSTGPSNWAGQGLTCISTLILTCVILRGRHLHADSWPTYFPGH